MPQVDRALIRAVAEVVEQELAPLRDQVDEYGNVIRREVAAAIAALENPFRDGIDGERGPPGDPGARGEPGPPGERGPGIWNHKRAYDARADYVAGDVVAHDGGASVALVDNPGECPGEHWAQICQRGKPGKPGKQGERGVGIDALFVERGCLVVRLTDGRRSEFPLAEVAEAVAA